MAGDCMGSHDRSVNIPFLIIGACLHFLGLGQESTVSTISPQHGFLVWLGLARRTLSLVPDPLFPFTFCCL